MLLTFVEASVKVACQSTTTTDCSQRANYMSLILVEVFTYSGKSICESGLSVHDSHSLQSQNYLNATYFGGSIHDKPLRYVLIPVICMLATPVMSRCDLTRLHLDKIFFFLSCAHVQTLKEPNN